MSLLDSAKLAKTYQSKTPREHIYDAPDTYIGAVEEDDKKDWVLNDDGKFENSNMKWVPGLYKCFDEGIVNSRDHVIRLQQKKKEKNIIQVKNIDISVDKETGIITMRNGGNGIDIAKHPEKKWWIPEMIFGRLRTSTNYDKKQKKIVGGKNGFGFKLVLIYAKWGEIETVDHIRKLKYTQRFENNLKKICKPVITSCSGRPYTQVRWLPDYERFGLEGLSDDMYNLFKKRTIDIAAVTDKSVKVSFNDELIPIKTFEDYIDKYIGPKLERPRLTENEERWEYSVCLSPIDEFTQVSFVNGINTSKGGKHVDYLINQITKKMVEYIKKRKKITVRGVTIKEQLMIFINCVIENPSFDSQTKDYMSTPIRKFGSKCEINDKFIEKLAKMGVMDAAISLNEIKDCNAGKKNNGKKTRSIRGVPKLIDANNAGGPKSQECTLILSEGDSAKSGIVSGLTKEDRDFIGVFPLKGKLMNVNDMSAKRINENEEITKIKKIMGLEADKSYTKEEMIKCLRYGKLLIMTDQDLDGSHIKGLCINLFHSQWHDLIKIDNFLGFMNTPILKARKGKAELSFYNESDYLNWKESTPQTGWRVKYYKGLGTSTAKEFKEYFKKRKIVTFKFDTNCDNSIDKAFNKGRADDRKDWLGNYDKDNVLDNKKKHISYEAFIDKELIHFSKYDCERSINNLIDGFKTSTRKITFAAFKRNLTKEIKVAQFSGYVSEHSAYHHGEMSLNKAIVGLAQEYTGSNNINTLLPNGQFGTRLEGGKDAASERYIFTQINPLMKHIINPLDNPILNYLDDDGTSVEPDFYLPIIPMILVNGGKGIGTGYSYEGLSYNPVDISNYIKNKLKNKKNNTKMFPYYEGFTGTVTELPQGRWLVKGTYKILSFDTIQITELPIGTWTVPYKAFLEKELMDDKNNKKPVIKKIKDMCTDALVDITIKFQPGILSSLISKKYDTNINLLEKTLKLYTTKSTSNMNLFDHKQRLRKYECIEDIIDVYYPLRYNGYKLRKEYQLKELEKRICVLSNKARFIKEQCDNVIDLKKKKKDQVIELLFTRNYAMIDNDKNYKYLRGMTFEQLEEENFERLLHECKEKQQEFDILIKKTVEDLWLHDLKCFDKDYEIYKQDRSTRILGEKIKKKEKISKK